MVECLVETISCETPLEEACIDIRTRGVRIYTVMQLDKYLT